MGTSAMPFMHTAAYDIIGQNVDESILRGENANIYEIMCRIAKKRGAIVSGGRIYRPAYKNVSPERDFVPLANRK